MQNTKPKAGYICILLTCFANAVSFVFISHLTRNTNAFLSIFMTFSYALIIFNAIQFKKLAKLYSTVFANKKVLLQMNVVTLVNWLSTFMSLRYLDPATALCINLGILSITIFLISTPMKQLKANKHLGASVLLVVLSLGLIVRQYMQNFSIINPSSNLGLGLLWCTIGGISGASIGLASEAMGKAGFTVTGILATRFYLLILASGMSLLFFHPTAIMQGMDWKYYLLSAIIIVFIPLLMYQIAIRELGTMIVSLLEPFSPVLTYILQISLGYGRFNPLTLTLLVFACAAVVWFVRVEHQMRHGTTAAAKKNRDCSS
jgi:drug/metabolite transporter (DMT)-like permease